MATNKKRVSGSVGVEAAPPAKAASIACGEITCELTYLANSCESLEEKIEQLLLRLAPVMGDESYDESYDYELSCGSSVGRQIEASREKVNYLYRKIDYLIENLQI